MPLIIVLSDRSSLSILAVPNAYLTTDDHFSQVTLVDVLRYHALLQFLSQSDLHALPPPTSLSPHSFKPLATPPTTSAS
ncbi:hypothetical protein glysoja_045865 [Glycine soja]|uniref:Uncharacterized protein n=1 Tax=Glycine soja TaxID=3848 RepID=A0A0B2RV53_GLYSO|nr:hypothetical protein glysoja_045865 [Glycine soja]